MTDTQSWAWSGAGTLPGFNRQSSNNLGSSQNGWPVNPSEYRDITWVDANSDGAIFDKDGGDGTTAKQDRVIIDGQSKQVHEVARYQASTMVVDGQTYTVNLVVWVFSDGTYMVRIPDEQIPAGHHHSGVTDLQLGQWDGRESAGSSVQGYDDQFVCFAAGTLIATPQGARRVEDLRPGDLVTTLDAGSQRLVWTGGANVRATGSLAPIRIMAGTLCNTRDLWVSPQHRMLLSGWRAALWFGEAEVLVPAKALVNDRTIRRDARQRVTYVHLLFDSHHIILAEGAPSESLFLGDQARDAIGPAGKTEILDHFPDFWAAIPSPAAFVAARRLLSVGEGRILRD